MTQIEVVWTAASNSQKRVSYSNFSHLVDQLVLPLMGIWVVLHQASLKPEMKLETNDAKNIATINASVSYFADTLDFKRSKLSLVSNDTPAYIAPIDEDKLRTTN